MAVMDLGAVRAIRTWRNGVRGRAKRRGRSVLSSMSAVWGDSGGVQDPERRLAWLKYPGLRARDFPDRDPQKAGSRR